MISKYKAMWVLVAFDLPVLTQKQRRVASGFREYLKNLGFVKLQNSVYSYYACTKERSDSISAHIKQHIPDNGHICVLFFTDRMFEMTKNYYGKLKVDIEQPDFFDTLIQIIEPEKPASYEINSCQSLPI